MVCWSCSRMKFLKIPHKDEWENASQTPPIFVKNCNGCCRNIYMLSERRHGWTHSCRFYYWKVGNEGTRARDRTGTVCSCCCWHTQHLPCQLSQFKIDTAVGLPAAQQVMVVSHCWPLTDIAVHLILVYFCLSEYIFPLVEARCLLCSRSGCCCWLWRSNCLLARVTWALLTLHHTWTSMIHSKQYIIHNLQEMCFMKCV